MAQLPTSNAYVNAFITSERRHLAGWRRSINPNVNVIFLDDMLQQNGAYLSLNYDNDYHLTALTYHPASPANGVLVLFRNNLWHDLAFNQIHSRYIKVAVRRIMRYWTPSHWRGF
ncbi:hypothetical protein [Xenorhabdus griffiniae]|uniref:Uncharacterized protein n=1 Tax=Xenorhabdus griffiniae TaxID=351672 RepID=A0ABY9XMM7_9GAMM|nr:hypothetical protein [Xenorhabdus griffiniae]MBD1228780.1 hypothetical protein [Xenorhabdus griffiniae]MBE8588394.1 hypothetical protein [Xenorhabdus griffiniae]WMV74071.1 hypothetical protein QL128_08800 [Xenorhabdus griffiniae]WNH03751.1 hypothetical protein QL112_008805 [Xenorhabdus griffiniae]